MIKADGDSIGLKVDGGTVATVDRRFLRSASLVARGVPVVEFSALLPNTPRAEAVITQPLVGDHGLLVPPHQHRLTANQRFGK